MRQFLKKLIYFLLLLAFFVEVLVIGSQYLEKKIENRNPPQSLNQNAEQKMERVHLVEGLGASKEWELFAEAAEGFIGQGRWSLQKVKVIFYARTGDSYTVQGKTGQIDVTSKDIDIEGDVSTHSTNGYEFVTTKLFYRSKEKILKVPESLALKGPKDQSGQRLHLRGTGISTYLENSLMNIESNVVASRQMTGGKILKIQSQKAQLSGQSNLVRFYDSVKMYYDDFLIQGPEALFAYQKGVDVPQSIIVNGGVQVTDPNKKAFAENLKIDLNEDRYVLRGSPKVLQEDDELNGEEIVFLEGGKRVKVQNIKAKVNEMEQGEK